MPPLRDLVIGSAGHIDHGKTSLVRALTGIDTDRLPAEKQRGITIDLGFAALELGRFRLAIVDVPGHERFIRNMVAGASGLDLALLAVAADDSVMPQTREHLEILGFLNLRGGVIALTKCDLVDHAWLDLVEDEVRQLVAGTFLAQAPIVRTSASTGLGLDALRSALADACQRVPDSDDPGHFRMPIDRSFTLAGHGTIVTGTVASGSIAVGDPVEWWPAGRRLRVRGLHRHDRPVERVARGMRAAINLTGVHHSEIGRGHELAEPGYLAATSILSVELAVTRDAARPLRHRRRYTLHIGTAEVTASLALFDTSEARPGSIQRAQLLLARPVVAVWGEPFVLREQSPPATVGGGRVVEPTASRIRPRDRVALDRLERRTDGDPPVRVLAALERLGLEPPDFRSLSRESGLPDSQLPNILTKLHATGALVEIPLAPQRTTFAPSSRVAELEDRILRVVQRGHAARPRLSALRRGEVVAALSNLGPEPLVCGLIDRLSAAGRLTADRHSLALPDHVPRLTQAERKLKDELAAAICSGGLAPPDLSQLTALAGPRAASVPDLLELLVIEGRIVEIGGGLWIDRQIEQAVRAQVSQRLLNSGSEGLTMAGLRDLLATTRKYAVPLGEYLDRQGITRREGDLRFAGPALARDSLAEPTQP
ncbi:MAG: selenocysteine-specific translation factor [Isosphaeraceae bacterium]|jgi:selenocysteine-specific elongation factor|nr:MAG: selenocysteine-specific translation factor [Isosphaeraceae bacterium]